VFSTRLFLLPWLVLSAGLGLTWLLWDHEQVSAKKELRSHFEFALSDTVSSIEQRMAAYEQMLRGVQGLFATINVNDRENFHNYVEALRLDANFSGTQTIGVSLLVPAEAKSAHLINMRRKGFADYRIEPAGQREVYAPVIQREPDIGRNRIQPGYDAWANPVRRNAMELARDSGMAALTGKVQLMVDNTSDAQPAFIMYLPIYAQGQPRETIEQRRANLVGWVFAAFRMNDLMASLYGEKVPGVTVEIHDGIEPSPATLLYRSSQIANPANSAQLNAEEYLVIAGHNWTLSLHADDDFKNHFSNDAAPLIAGTGIVLSLLLAVLAWLLLSGRTHALKLAATMTKELRESEQRWAFALEGAGDGVWDWNLQTRVAITSRRWNQIIGCADDGFMRTIDDWEARIAPDDKQEVMAAIQTCLASPPGSHATCVAEHRLRCYDGSWKWVLFRGMIIEWDEKNRPLRIIGTISDISERKATEERMRHMAQHDTLTNLPNRALFSDRLQRELANAKRHRERFALIFLDLDNFKPINDNFGHGMGDRLLQAVARRLEESIRASDTAGRIGGDEFIILLPKLQTSNDALNLAEKIRLYLQQPFTIDGHELNISSSLGIAVYPENGSDEVALTKSADRALYQAKEEGRNKVVSAQIS
jgi:diguanylate cyclase (GGDEF)-like protein/PAS domain S-box-containing protein